MSPTNFNDLITVLGGVPITGGFPFSKDSKYFFVDPARGSSGASGAFEDPCDKISTALALCTANQHDTVIYISGASGCTEPEAIVWDKSYTHLIGIAAPVRTAQRARIFAADALAATPFFSITGDGCIFKNIYIFHGTGEAAALGNVYLDAERCYFENVHFAGAGSTEQAVDGCYSLGIYGGAGNATKGEHLFKDCTFGVTTIAMATGGRLIALLGGYSARNVFEDCTFAMYSASAAAMMIEDDSGGASIIEYMLFKNCLFFNESEQAIDTVFEIDTVGVTRQHFLLLNCWKSPGIDDWEDQAKACVFAGAMQDMGTASSQGDMVVATVT